MIYVSSSCVRAKTIKEAVLKLKESGFFNIELSSGTEYYDGLKDDLFELKDRHNMRFLLHNYFPPPKEHFVINLASLDDSIYTKSETCLKNALDLCKGLGIKRFGFHAGFFVDIQVPELSRQIPGRALYDKKTALERFCSGFIELEKYAAGIKLCVENNVFSSLVRKNYSTVNPFMLTNYDDYLEMSGMIGFNLLIDVAHLNVTCGTLGLNFSKELRALMPHSDYLHLSDVSGKGRQHMPFAAGSHVLKSLREFDLTKKTITLEIYGSMNDLKRSHQMVKDELL